MDIDATALRDDPSSTVVVRPCEADELVSIRREFPGLPAEPAGTTLVAWVDGKPVGHIQIRWRGSVHSYVRARLPKTPEIRRLRVHPDAQGRGAAKALLREAEELAVARGHRSVGLAVGVTNETAIGLYQRCGYELSGIANFHSSMGMDDNGRRYTHTVQYMVKAVGRSARALVVA
jgi:ribosomal protein S18 acetylase RimI-like enzyme